jgi:hypothetical protein
MKCKLHATLWNPSCNPPQLPPCEFIISSSMFSSWNLKVLGFFYLLYCMCHLPLRVTK